MKCTNLTNVKKKGVINQFIMFKLTNKGDYPYNLMSLIDIDIKDNMNNEMISKFEKIIKKYLFNDNYFNLLMLYFRDKKSCTQIFEIVKDEKLNSSPGVIVYKIRKSICRLQKFAVKYEIITTVFNKEYEITPDTDITILDLPSATINSLRHYKINTIGELYNDISENPKWFEKVYMVDEYQASVILEKLYNIYGFEHNDEITSDTNIAMLNMSTSVTNALKRAGINTVGELHNVISQNRRWYKEIRCVSKTRAITVVEKMHKVYKFEEA